MLKNVSIAQVFSEYMFFLAEKLFTSPYEETEILEIEKLVEKQGEKTTNKFFVTKCTTEQRRNWDIAYKK